MSHEIKSAPAGPALGLMPDIALQTTAQPTASGKTADQLCKRAERAWQIARLDIVPFLVIGFFVARPVIG